MSELVASSNSDLDELDLREDADDLDVAIAEGGEFVNYLEARAELKREGKL